MVTRFITKKGWIENHCVTAEAFLPIRHESGRFETSIIDCEELSPEEIWEKGKTLFNTFYGRADIIKSEIQSLSLDIEIDDIPIEKHGNIINWPDEEEARRFIAEKLVEKSTTIENRYKR
ncbi:MAG: hypothetical protein SNJ55_03640 [Chloroherpetonaceae bacterium]